MLPICVLITQTSSFTMIKKPNRLMSYSLKRESKFESIQNKKKWSLKGLALKHIQTCRKEEIVRRHEKEIAEEKKRREKVLSSMVNKLINHFKKHSFNFNEFEALLLISLNYDSLFTKKLTIRNIRIVFLLKNFRFSLITFGWSIGLRVPLRFSIV